MNFEKTQELVTLSFQKKQSPLPTQKFDVKLLVDKSGSMQEEFESGWVSKTIDLFTACSSKFDDDGNLTVGFFNHGYQHGKVANKQTFGSYFKGFYQKAEGTTQYAQAIDGILATSLKSTLFGFLKTKPKTKLSYLAMITDGDCADYSDFIKTVNSFDSNLFFQVIVIGNQVTIDKLKFLNQFTNCDYVLVPDPHNTSEEKFLELVISDKFINWTKNLSKQ